MKEPMPERLRAWKKKRQMINLSTEKTNITTLYNLFLKYLKKTKDPNNKSKISNKATDQRK